MRRKSYFSPLILAAQLQPGDDPIIIIGGSMDTGGIGECFEETAMFSGKYGAEVYFLNGDGTKTLVGYHQVIEEAPDYDSYYDLEGNEIDMAEYMFDFEMYVGETFNLWCDYGMGGL